jgi:hypothetical protein
VAEGAIVQDEVRPEVGTRTAGIFERRETSMTPNMWKLERQKEGDHATARKKGNLRLLSSNN